MKDMLSSAHTGGSTESNAGLVKHEKEGNKFWYGVDKETNCFELTDVLIRKQIVLN